MNQAPWARWAKTVAAAYERLAVDLDVAAVEAEQAVLVAPPAEIEDGRTLGRRQREISELPELADEAGLRTAEVAERIGYEVPNTHTALRSLMAAGVVELIPNSAPQRWRLAARYRGTATLYLAMAARVRSGEWTAYGDISIAVRGDTMGARAVGRAAATSPIFPNPHRVLLEGGRIPDGWRSDNGDGPEECRRRLKEEGVTFTPDGRADSTCRVTWDVLVEREGQKVQEPKPTTAWSEFADRRRQRRAQVR